MSLGETEGADVVLNEEVGDMEINISRKKDLLRRKDRKGYVESN